MANRDISICDQTGSETAREISICNQNGTPVDREISICKENCPAETPFLYSIEDGGNGQKIITFSGGLPPYQFLDGESWENISSVYNMSPSQCPPLEPFIFRDACDSQISIFPATSYQELEITGTDEPVVGSQYFASSGKAPFRWGFSGGTIDSTGKITSITSCGGPDGNGAVASVSVSDECKNTASIEVRLSGGGWVLVDVHEQPVSCLGANPCAETGWVWRDEQISGGTRISVKFIHGNQGFLNCGDPISNCDPLYGWSFSRCITPLSYFGAPFESTIVYQIIGPSCAYEYKWEC